MGCFIALLMLVSGGAGVQQGYRVVERSPIAAGRKPAVYLSRLYVPLRDSPLPGPLPDNPIREPATDDDVVFGKSGRTSDPLLRPDRESSLVPAGIVLGNVEIVERNGTRYLAGVVRNDRKVPVSISVSVNLMDADKHLLRNGSDSISDLAPSQKWPFLVPLVAGEVSYKITHVEVK